MTTPPPRAQGARRHPKFQSRPRYKFTGAEGILAQLDKTGYLMRAFVVLSRVNHVTDEAVTDYF